MSSTVRNQSIVFTSYLSGDSSFNCDAHLGTNLNNTTMLSSIPSAVSTSEGTYIFKKSSTGKAMIVNAAGVGSDSSIDFVGVSSTVAPKTFGNLSSTGLTVGDAKFETDAIKFSGVDYKALVDSHTAQIAGLTSFDITEVVKNAQLDAVDAALTARIVTSESDIVSLKAKDIDHDSKISALEYQDTLELGRISVLETDVTKAKQDILNLAAVDVTELAKISDLEAKDVIYAARFVVDEAKIDVLEKKQPIIVSQPIYHVASVYADSQQMIDYIPASISAVTPYSGFYFKNELNKKVNWYLAGFAGMKVKDIKAIMLNFYNVTATTGLGCPFFTAYTKTDDLTPNSASWYKSRKTFSVEYTSATTPSTAYNLLANLKSIPYTPIAWNHKKVDAVGIPSNDKGLFADEEEVLFFSVGSSSNSASGLFEFIASKFTIFTSDCSYEYQFIQK
jgi:hypothetical protein